MRERLADLGNSRKWTLFAIAFISLLSVIIWDLIFRFDSSFRDGIPNFSILYIIRSIIIVLSVATFFCSASVSSPSKLSPIGENAISLERISIWLVLLLGIIILVLFIAVPKTFNDLSREDNLTEWLSAIFLFVSSFITLYAFLIHYKSLRNYKVVKVLLGLLSLGLLVMAFEEVSWFQRQLDLDPSELFAENNQNETNLHNFATDYIENIYYFGAFVFMVLLPFLRFLNPDIVENNNIIKIFVPRPFIALIGAVACAYNYDMWNIVFTQFAFFGSIAILSSFGIYSKLPIKKSLIFFAIALLLASQILFLTNGDNFQRIYEITEYKEFLIALGWLIYCMDIFHQLKHKYAGADNAIKISHP